jgi:hypothetical protein
MQFPLPQAVIDETTSERFRHHRRDPDKRHAGDDKSILVDLSSLRDSEILELRDIAVRIGESRTGKALTALISADRGDVPVPNFDAFLPLLKKRIGASRIKGWIWEMGPDGILLPWVVTRLIYRRPDNRNGLESPDVALSAKAWSFVNDERLPFRVVDRTWVFTAGEVVRRNVGDVLRANGLFLETQALVAAHEVSMARHDLLLSDGFASLHRVTGPAFQMRGYRHRDMSEPVGRKVIHDTDHSMIGPCSEMTESEVFGGRKNAEAVEMPRHPLLRVFDLSIHETFVINTDHLEPHVFDMSLRDKLVLPPAHRDLLDVLTSDISVFTADFIEGKSAGNIILCKGLPGVGKTLTAEVYAEITEKPLYSIQAGTLGTTAAKISESLKDVFQRAKRWDCVLLIDEADVFVMRRGDNIETNAVVSEFLRALEYFDGLLIMTTNRPDDIDEAILSRCAAIISYDPPSPAAARDIWNRLAESFGAPLPAALVEQLVAAFPEITGRDIKMLLRLSLRVAASRSVAPDIEIFRQCAMFRGLTARTETAA